MINSILKTLITITTTTRHQVKEQRIKNKVILDYLLLMIYEQLIELKEWGIFETHIIAIEHILECIKHDFSKHQLIEDYYSKMIVELKTIRTLKQYNNVFVNFN